MAASPAAVLTGVGAWLPPRIVTNHEVAELLGPGVSDEHIRKLTGISQRHRVCDGMSTSDLAVEAGRRALYSASYERADAVVLATTTPDHHCPATAPTVATRLGLTGAVAFDVAATCSGFIYALQAAAGLIATGTAATVLVIGADAISTIVNPNDRDTAPIFGDGAGAMLVRAGSSAEPGALGPMVLGSDGTGNDLIQVPAGGVNHRSPGCSPVMGQGFLRMRGHEVFKTAIPAFAAAAEKALILAGWKWSDIAWFAPHQANARILAALARELKIDTSIILSNIANTGNTVAASIPLVLTQAALRGNLTAGDKVLLAAFGGGLTWGATTLTWPQMDSKDEECGIY